MALSAFASGRGKVVVDGHGGRVAELRPDPDGPNLLWRGDTAPVPGGDRLWPAPELDIFYDGDTWRCPPELDPGDWDLTTDAEVVRLRQDALGAVFSRRVEPLRGLAVSPELTWAGYHVRDTVDGPDAWSAWHIVMVPASARVFVRGAGDPVTYYPPAPTVADGWIDVADAPPRWKVGFDPPPDRRVLLAALGSPDPGPLVAVASTAPAGTYVDRVPDDDRTTAVQLYSSGGNRFCELEHHAPRELASTDALVVGVWGPRDARLAFLDELEARLGELVG